MGTGHRILYDLIGDVVPYEMNDPGAAGAILIDRQLGVVPLVHTTGDLTRTLAAPTHAGVIVHIVLQQTTSGTLEITITGGYDQAGSTTVTFGDAGDYITLASVPVGAGGTTFRWRVLGFDGVTGPAIEMELSDITAESITGGDNNLGITGQTQATTVNGGIVAIAGAASIAGATGAGGNATITGGACGATNGAGGQVNVTGGTGKGTGNGGSTTLTGGVAGVTGGGGNATLTGGETKTGSETGTGGNAYLTGGANANTTNGAGGLVRTAGGAGKGTGAGGVAHLVGGAAAGSADGGNVILTGGTSGSGVAGGIIMRSDTIFTQDAPTAEAAGNQVIAAADFVNGIVVHTVTAAATLTTPTGAQITAVLPDGVANGDAFYLRVITLGAGADDISTLTAGDGDVTFIGDVTVGPAAAGTTSGATFLFRLVDLATDVYVGYRVG